ncbi:MAG TPA: peptidylprolyl isomerase, partial [Burkholderiaceae bacterium]
RPLKGLKITKLQNSDLDGWAPVEGLVDGWPVAADPKTGKAWLTHCYSMVGAARGGPADSSDGSGLYTVIGHAPRTLDLNITTVGRVLSGMERLTALPRGTGNLGFYEKAEQRVPITRVRVMADIPEAERPKLQVMRTDLPIFKKVLDTRRYRVGNGWHVHDPKRVELCGALPPVRPTP